MSRNVLFLAMAALAGAAVSCDSGHHPSWGFRLPPGGDVERGKAAFVELKCNSCHEVAALDLPKPTVQPAVPVVIGGVLHNSLSDGEIVTSIIHPSYELAKYPKNLITTSTGASRMPPYVDTMTVRQLMDLVAFVKSRYTVRSRVPVDAASPDVRQ